MYISVYFIIFVRNFIPSSAMDCNLAFNFLILRNCVRIVSTRRKFNGSFEMWRALHKQVKKLQCKFRVLLILSSKFCYTKHIKARDGFLRTASKCFSRYKVPIHVDINEPTMFKVVYGLSLLRVCFALRDCRWSEIKKKWYAETACVAMYCLKLDHYIWLCLDGGDI